LSIFESQKDAEQVAGSQSRKNSIPCDPATLFSKRNPEKNLGAIDEVLS
jgi:hypothetical protein